MNMYDIIYKKRDGYELSDQEINFFVSGYVDGKIPDYQVSSLLMAIYFKGMNKRETAGLTKAMINSGNIIDLSSIKGIKADKHSTGGVGDTTTLIVAPLVAACGVSVAKMSGRGLGHTGGTIDKLESIPGFNVSLEINEFINNVNKIGLSIMSQTKDIVPADKKLYALRDVTATVESMPLIASSIMSKKIASGADVIVLDVKSGSGAFMNTLEESFALAEEMVDIGTAMNRKTIAVVTDMDQPLGMAVGNSLEVIEAIEVLNGTISGPLKDVSVILASHMLILAGRCRTEEEAEKVLDKALTSGKALGKFKEMIKAQGGDARVCNDISYLPCSKNIIPIRSKKEGYLSSVNAHLIGNCALLLGAGRSTKEGSIDYGVGLVMRKRVGDFISTGETIADFYVNNEKNLNNAIDEFYNAVSIINIEPEKRPLIYGVVSEKGIIRI